MTDSTSENFSASLCVLFWAIELALWAFCVDRSISVALYLYCY